MAGVQTAPSVMFHVNVPDTLAYAVRLLRKAHQSGFRVHVLCGEQEVSRLSGMLWSLPGEAFLPHSAFHPDRFSSQRERVPIWLDGSVSPLALCPVVLNLGLAEVRVAHTLNKLIEVVGTSDYEMSAARARWRSYLSRGWQPQKFERGLESPDPSMGKKV